MIETQIRTQSNNQDLISLGLLDQTVVRDYVKFNFFFLNAPKNFKQDLYNTLLEMCSIMPYIQSNISIDPKTNIATVQSGDGITVIEHNKTTERIEKYAQPNKLNKIIELPIMKDGIYNVLLVLVYEFSADNFVLNFSFHHCLFDTCSINTFLRIFEKLSKGENFKQPKLIENQLDLKLLSNYHKNFLKDPPNMPLVNNDDVTDLYMEFTKDATYHMKKAYNTDSDNWITTNDIITSIIWKNHITKTKAINKKEMSSIGFLVNLRQFKHLDLDLDMIGNAILVFSCSLSTDFIINSSISEISRKVREEIKKINKESIEEKVKKIKDYKLKSGNIIFSDHLVFDLFFSSFLPFDTLRSFDIAGCSSSFTTRTLQKKGLVNILPTENGISVIMGVEKEEVKFVVNDPIIKKYMDYFLV